jgi:hypothetical protein
VINVACAEAWVFKKLPPRIAHLYLRTVSSKLRRSIEKVYLLLKSI